MMRGTARTFPSSQHRYYTPEVCSMEWPCFLDDLDMNHYHEHPRAVLEMPVPTSNAQIVKHQVLRYLSDCLSPQETVRSSYTLFSFGFERVRSRRRFLIECKTNGLLPEAGILEDPWPASVSVKARLLALRSEDPVKRLELRNFMVDLSCN